MSDFKKIIHSVVVVAIMSVFGNWAYGELPEVVGTFGVTSIEPTTAVAIWVPVEPVRRSKG
jgi:hypothetical protein